jgi:hypothetical protein
MRVYRVENIVKGHGPYAGWSEYREIHAARMCDCGNEIDPQDIGDIHEHEDECAYREANSFHSDLMWSDTSIRPIPQDDGCADFMHHWIFGFVSLDALWAWFDEFLDDLDYYGYRIVEYIADGGTTVGKSGQVAFNPDYARAVAASA